MAISKRFGTVLTLLTCGGFPHAVHSQTTTTEEANTTSSAPATFFGVDPVCGFSKRNLDEDPMRRHCLRQCILGDDGVVQPVFDEWEEYCRETAGMTEWDPQCSVFFTCLFGCDVWGGDSSTIRTAAPATRYEYLVETKADMFSAGMTRELRCTLEKCQSYCARRVFMTCRETQYSQKCFKTNPTLYGCDVDCNGAWHSFVPGWTTLALVLGLVCARQC